MNDPGLQPNELENKSGQVKAILQEVEAYASANQKVTDEMEKIKENIENMKLLQKQLEDERAKYLEIQNSGQNQMNANHNLSHLFQPQGNSTCKKKPKQTMQSFIGHSLTEDEQSVSNSNVELPKLNCL